jgi:hypothetical protein
MHVLWTVEVQLVQRLLLPAAVTAHQTVTMQVADLHETTSMQCGQ